MIEKQKNLKWIGWGKPKEVDVVVPFLYPKGQPNGHFPRGWSALLFECDETVSWAFLAEKNMGRVFLGVENLQSL